MKPLKCDSPPIFVIGSQRSGTTLLRLILNAHSKVAIPEEGTFWMPLLRKRRGNLGGNELENWLKYIKKNSQFQLWRMETKEAVERIRKKGNCSLAEVMSAFYEDYLQMCKKSIWGDKTPSFFRMVPVLASLFPDARFIYVVRDGRDVYLSWRKMNPSKNNISIVAVEWIYKLQKAKKALEALDVTRSLEIRYEDLVCMPDETLKKICNFLALEYESTMLNYWKTSDRFIGSHHSKLIFRPVSSKSVGKWKRELSQKEVCRFELIAGRALASHGYELSQDASRCIENLLGAIFQLAYGLPQRAAQVFLNTLNQYVSATFGFEICKTDVGVPPSKALDRDEK